MSRLTRLGFFLSLLFIIAGCAQQHGSYAYNHGHTHGHGHTHTLHDGIVVPLFSAQQPVGFAELKLHDDKGDLELWLAKDNAGGNPFDLPLNSEITVSFIKLDTKTATLQVRNIEKNEDEDGKGNIRGSKTNYFIFPGDTGADATFLTGKEFASEVVISFVVDGVIYTTETFKLRPHTH